MQTIATTTEPTITAIAAGNGNDNTQSQDASHSNATDLDSCNGCRRPFHPVEAVRKLAPELEVAFQIPDFGEDINPPKRRRLNPTARHITGEEIMQQLREKEESSKKKKKEIAEVTNLYI